MLHAVLLAVRADFVHRAQCEQFCEQGGGSTRQNIMYFVIHDVLQTNT